MKLKLKFPFVREFDDYHEIDFFRDTLQEFLVEKIKGIELGFDYNSGEYIGLFYMGKKPSKDVIQKLLEEREISFEEPEEPFWDRRY